MQLKGCGCQMAGHPCMRPNFWQPTRIWRLWDREPMATLRPNKACIFLRAALSSGSMVMGHETENTGDAGTSVTLPVSGTSNYATAATAVIDRSSRSSSVGPCRNLSSYLMASHRLFVLNWPSYSKEKNRTQLGCHWAVTRFSRVLSKLRLGSRVLKDRLGA